MEYLKYAGGVNKYSKTEGPKVGDPAPDLPVILLGQQHQTKANLLDLQRATKKALVLDFGRLLRELWFDAKRYLFLISAGCCVSYG